MENICLYVIDILLCYGFAAKIYKHIILVLGGTGLHDASVT